MKFKNLKQEDIDYARTIYKDKSRTWDERMEILIKFFGKSERTTRKWCSKLEGFKEKADIIPEQIEIAKKKQHDTNKQRFLITSAQNATRVNTEFWKNLIAYALYINAEILVIPFKYHNPTSIITDNDKKQDWWDDKLLPYLTLNRHKLNDRISILADISIQPTADSPTQGLENMTGDHSSVIGHPRLEVKTVPVMDVYKPKIMFTTGACTVPNYTPTKAGKKGEFHFCTGFAIVELQEDDRDSFFFRQISANDKTGEFIDLYFNVKNGVVTRESSVDGVIMGDIHVSSCDQKVIDKTLNDLFKKLHPNKIFLHDVMDSNSISHHNLNDPFLQHEQEMSGANSLEKEMGDMVKWLKQVEDYNVYVVKSNHDTHIDKFLRTTDWRKMSTFKNAIPYMEYSLATLRGEAKNGIVPYIINKHYPKFKCLTYNDSVVVNGVLLSMHGDKGANGSRGGLRQFSRLSKKNVTAHSHTIGRIGGALSVGTSSFLRMGYTEGPSTWINAHCLVNRLGKTQHIVFFHTKNGLQYTTLE